MNNHGNYIISLGNLCRWLAQQAEGLGVEIYPGFAAAEVLYHEDGSVRGVATGDLGIGNDGQHTENYQPGMELHAKQTIFAEGCRGSLTKDLMQKFNLREGVDPQAYGIGIKELWEVKPERHQAGLIVHTIGWPVDSQTYGGSFLYHLENNQVAVGFVVGLDYQNTWMSPFDEFQRFKTHPAIRGFSRRGRISYGARDQRGRFNRRLLSFLAVLIGDTVGFLNNAKIKGIHTAMKSGTTAPGGVRRAGAGGNEEVTSYSENAIGIWDELYRVQHPSVFAGVCGVDWRTRRRYLPVPGQGAVDAAQPRRPQRAEKAADCNDRVSQAGRQNFLR